VRNIRSVAIVCCLALFIAVDVTGAMDTTAPAAGLNGRAGSPVRLTRRGVADPFVFSHGRFHYVFGTSPGNHVLRTQSFRQDDFKWFKLRFDFGADRDRVHGVWAFRVYRHTDGSFHGYAGVHYGFFRTMVGHFVPAAGEAWGEGKPILSWKLDGILVGDLKLGQFAYDPGVVRDNDGTLYLIYCSGSPNEVTAVDIHVKVRRMLDPATLDLSFEPRAILSPGGFRSEDRNPGFVQIVEAPHLHRIGGKWLMLYSVGDFSGNNYKLGVAWSDSLIPPSGRTYEKPLIPDPRNLWKNETTGTEVRYLLQSEKPDWPNYVGDRVFGPGVGTLVELGGAASLVFHGRGLPGTDGKTGERDVWILPVRVDTRAGTPVGEWITPLLPEKDD
jgi:hypothetical protein